MKVIGLTGSIGTGKSTVADYLRKRGIPVLDADRAGHEVYRHGTEAYKKIVEAFGRKILDADGAVDRKALADLVFQDERKRVQLEKITHPEIKKRMRDFILACEREGHPFCVIEAALIFEKGRESLFDGVITVSASRKDQVERLKERDGLTDLEIRKRIDAQMSLREKMERSDLIVDNSGSFKDTEGQVVSLIEELKKLL